MARGELVKESGAAFWDANPCGGDWDSYEAFMAWIQETEPYIFDILACYDWAGKQILEVGCSQGTTLNYLPRLGPNVVGIDMSFQSLQQARAGALELSTIEQIRLASADAERLLLPTCHLQLCWSYLAYQF